MMSGFMSYFGGRRDPKQSTREAIVTLRQQLQMLEKKEDHLQKKIDDELKQAKTNAVGNKKGKYVFFPLPKRPLSVEPHDSLTLQSLRLRCGERRPSSKSSTASLGRVCSLRCK